MRREGLFRDTRGEVSFIRLFSRNMTKKELLLLLIPTIAFLFLALSGLAIPIALSQKSEDKLRPPDVEKFQRFETNVLNGTWELSSERWLEGMRLTYGASRASYEVAIQEREINSHLFKILNLLGLVALIGLGFQVWVIIALRQKRKEQSK